MTYDVVASFSVIAAEGLLLNSTLSNMNVITGDDCFAGGPVDFIATSPVEIYILYLLRQCQAQFVFHFEVCYNNNG